MRKQVTIYLLLITDGDNNGVIAEFMSSTQPETRHVEIYLHLHFWIIYNLYW